MFPEPVVGQLKLLVSRFISGNQRHRVFTLPSSLYKYAPAGVIINSALEIIQFWGNTSLYLSPAPGKPSFNLAKYGWGKLALRATHSTFGGEAVKYSKAHVS